MLRDAMKLADSIQITLSSMEPSDDRSRKEKALTKKCKELSVLGTSLVFKEKELLNSYKSRLE